ncbi:pol, partial [Symbiodinium microadriaticum]
MTCLRSSTFSQQHVRYHHVLPGRVLHVQARFRGGWVNLINIYQHCWDFQTDQDRIVKERAVVWKAVRQTIGQVPQGHFRMIAGDLNTAISSHAPWLGKGMLKAAANSVDAECLADLLSDTELVAVNTFGRHNSYTYIHDGYQQARKSGSGAEEANIFPSLSRFGFTRPTATSEWPIWKCKLLQQQVKSDPDIGLRFQQEVALALAESSDYHPHELNRKLLEIGRRVFTVHRPHSISPPWAQGAHVQTIKTMWLHYRHMKLARGVPGLRAVFQAMRHWASFQRLHRQVQRHSRRLRRQHMDTLLAEAQARDQVDGSGAVFDLLKRVAPKQARKRTQLRDDSGRIMTPAEEAHAQAAYWKDVCGSVHKTSMQEAPGGGDPFLTYDISPDDIKQALRDLHVGKAAPKHCTPHIMWKLAAEPIATFLEASVFSHWREAGARIPDAWPGAWLTFLSKPNKAGNKPDHLRPIALLEPAGKAVSGIIKEHLTPYLEAWTRHLHFYGYLGNRSTHQALDLVFAHCELVRTRTQAQGRSPYAKRAGIGQYKCIGGLQVSVDCTQAFDRIDRGLLLQALTLLQVPLPLVDIIMRWVQDTAYHINQDDCEETFTSRRGVRQGCKLSPTLWCCIMVFIAHSLDHSLGARWCLEHLVGFADDLHLRWTFSTLAEMHTALQQAAQALAILEKMSLVLSKEKTVCLLKAEGSQAPHAKKKIIVQTQDGKYLQLSPDYRLPLKRQHPYLGAIISYADFENQNAKHRVQAGKVAFQRLRPYLMNRRALSFTKRVALWKATVVSSTFYGITASGITPKGLDLMRVTLTKQVRAMANSPRHLTLESDHDFWQRLRLKAPADLLLDRAQAIQHRTQELLHIIEADDVRLSATIPAWENRVFTQLQTAGGIIPQHFCPSCHALFENKEALRAHIARKHSADRRQAEPTMFDHYRHGTDGMPQCSRCGHNFFRVPAQTVDSVAASPVTMVNAIIQAELRGPEAADAPSESTEPIPAELMDVFGACLPAVAQSLQSMQKRTDQNENPDSSLPKRPRTDTKDVEMEPTARQKAGPPRRGQHRRGNQTFGNSSGGLERLVVNMASLCLRQEEELQLMRVDKQFMIHFSSGPQGLLPSLYAVAQKWNEAKEKSPPEVQNSLRVCLVNS